MCWPRPSATTMPLLERLRYICIVSSNLDEFFEVRFADLLEAVSTGKDGVTHRDVERVAIAAHALIDEQYGIFNEAVMPALAAQGIVILNHADRNEAQRRWVGRFFEREVRPLLMPVSLDPAHLPAGGEQVAALHRAAVGQGRAGARHAHRHRQGAARAAACHQAAAPGVGRTPGLCC